MIKIRSFCFVARKQTASRVFFGRRWFPASLQEIRQWCVQLAALCGRSSGNIIRTVCDVHAGPGDYTEASNPAKRQSQKTDVMFVHDREKFFHVFLSKKQYFYFTAFIHSIRFSKIKQHDFSEKKHTGFVDSSTEPHYTPRGSHLAPPIAGDALNAWTVAAVGIRTIHRYLVHRVLPLCCGAILIAPLGYYPLTSWRIAHKLHLILLVIYLLLLIKLSMYSCALYIVRHAGSA